MFIFSDCSCCSLTNSVILTSDYEHEEAPFIERCDSFLAFSKATK